MKSLFFPLVVVAMLLMACVHYGANPNARYYLSKASLRATETEALEGDNAAANRIGDYYYFFKNDGANSMWWYKLAAIRGDSLARDSIKRLQGEESFSTRYH